MCTLINQIISVFPKFFHAVFIAIKRAIKFKSLVKKNPENLTLDFLIAFMLTAMVNFQTGL